MDYKKRKKELEEEFNKVQQEIKQKSQELQQLSIFREQLRGRYQEILELEKDKWNTQETTTKTKK